MRDLLTIFAPRPNNATAAKEARDRWIAKLPENLGLHARADRLESRDDRAQD